MACLGLEGYNERAHTVTSIQAGLRWIEDRHTTIVFRLPCPRSLSVSSGVSYSWRGCELVYGLRFRRRGDGILGWEYRDDEGGRVTSCKRVSELVRG